MSSPLTTKEVIERLPTPSTPMLFAPDYNTPCNDKSVNLVLGVASMKNHMTDEGWQITHGLSQNGYLHCGFGLPINLTDVPQILKRCVPGIDTLIIQDKREWCVSPGSFRDQKAQFTNVSALRDRNDIFKVTILKDAQQNPAWHSQAAEEMGCHAWICYYHEDIVHHLAPYTRPAHLIRTYHTVDPSVVPAFNRDRTEGCLLSGAISSAYPLRKRIFDERNMPVVKMHHPGYHRRGSNTPAYLQELSKFKVAICTASRYGYSLRKIIEAVACGCTVITDLPIDDNLPMIDDALVRISSDIRMSELKAIINSCVGSWDKERDYRERVAYRAVRQYDFRYQTALLADNIKTLKEKYL